MYEQKYKVGERVVIKPDELCKDEKDVGGGTTIELKRILAGTDRVMVVLEPDKNDVFNACNVSRGNKGSEVIRIMPVRILGPALDFHEECEVSNSGENWYKKHFLAYIPSADEPASIVTHKGNGGHAEYKYIRRIQPPTIEVTVLVNGEKKDPSSISEETWMNIRKS